MVLEITKFIDCSITIILEIKMFIDYSITISLEISMFMHRLCDYDEMDFYLGYKINTPVVVRGASSHTQY
jgi:hypothetical protein